MIQRLKHSPKLSITFLLVLVGALGCFSCSEGLGADVFVFEADNSKPPPEKEVRWAQELMARMRAVLAQQTYQFDLELKYKSQGKKGVTRIEGRLNGEEQEGIHHQSFILYYPSKKEDAQLEIQAIDGRLLQADRVGLHAALPDLGAFTPFDLLAPYLYWKEVRYLSDSKRGGRSKHHLEILAPKEEGGRVHHVQLEVQEPHCYLLKAECFDKNNCLLSTLKTLGIRRKKPYHPTKIEWSTPAHAEVLQIIFHNPLFGLDADPKIFDRLDKD